MKEFHNARSWESVLPYQSLEFGGRFGKSVNARLVSALERDIERVSRSTEI